MPAGSYVLLAKAGVNSGASARVVCRLFADSVELDKSILTSGSVAGYLSQGEITLMSAATLTATSTVTVSCRIEGGSAASQPFASQQQILAMRVGTASTTVINF